MFRWARKRWRSKAAETSRPGFVFDRPLVVLESDDWGRLGVRDREGWEQLRDAGLTLGERPYDFYTLETAENVESLREVLLRHRDAAGRSPCLVMNFVTANLDFTRMAAAGFLNVHLRALAEGLPGGWKREGLFDAYRRGVADGVFYPALHGASHFCVPAMEEQVAKESERRNLIRTLWEAKTPYIHWRMPWVGYEYWHPERAPKDRFLSAEEQSRWIEQAAEYFRAMFGTGPASACAPGYRANHDTHRAWARQGVRVAQNGPGSPNGCYMDENEMLQVCRNLDFEPATSGSGFSVEECLRTADVTLQRGVPLIVSLHSINFHSTIQDFCGPTLGVLDQFLTALELRYPKLLYVHDSDLRNCVNEGLLQGPQGAIKVTVTQPARSGSAEPVRRGTI